MLHKQIKQKKKNESKSKLEYILEQDWFWEMWQEQTGIDMSLKAILKRNSVCSEERLKEAQQMSNKNRIAKGKKPFYREIMEE